MYHALEFTDRAMGIVREEWLTQRKKECFWPPYKVSSKYNGCLLNGDDKFDEWNLYEIKRTICITDDIAIARERLKEESGAEGSEFVSEQEGPPAKTIRKPNPPAKRKRKPNKKFNISDDSDEDSPPQDSSFQLKLPQLPEGLNGDLRGASSLELVGSISEPTFIPPSRKAPNQESAETEYTSTPSCSRHLNSQKETPHQQPDILHDFSRHLAKIYGLLDRLDRRFTEVVEKSSGISTSTVPELPSCLNLSCETVDEVEKLEEGLVDDENTQNPFVLYSRGLT